MRLCVLLCAGAIFAAVLLRLGCVNFEGLLWKVCPSLDLQVIRAGDLYEHECIP